MNKRTWLKLMIVAVCACTTAVYAADPAPVKGNPNSKIYHKAACRHYSAKSSTKEFKSEPEAVKAGYKSCKQCAAPTAQPKPEKKK
jgi:methylphosphotriester-DNA--protein-cysteine methyltransferase